MTTKKAIFITTDANITMGDIDTDDLFENYELYSPISKYQLSIGVNPIHLLPKSKITLNSIASRIYRGAIIGDCVIVSDDDNEIEPYYNELIETYK